MYRIALAALLVGFFAVPAYAAKEKPITVNLEAQNNSGETGTATLTPEGRKTKVVIEMSNATAGVAQPAHIHKGTCANLDKAPKWKLKPVKDGKSTTVVPASLKTILKDKTAINVHKSLKEIKDYVACGDIVK
ncbi:MAG: hypothetical protein ACYCZQ_14215 [Burkholderiales bacterium]